MYLPVASMMLAPGSVMLAAMLTIAPFWIRMSTLFRMAPAPSEQERPRSRSGVATCVVLQVPACGCARAPTLAADAGVDLLGVLDQVARAEDAELGVREGDARRRRAGRGAQLLAVRDRGRGPLQAVGRRDDRDRHCDCDRDQHRGKRRLSRTRARPMDRPASACACILSPHPIHALCDLNVPNDFSISTPSMPSVHLLRATPSGLNGVRPQRPQRPPASTAFDLDALGASRSRRFPISRPFPRLFDALFDALFDVNTTPSPRRSLRPAPLASPTSTSLLRPRSPRSLPLSLSSFVSQARSLLEDPDLDPGSRSRGDLGGPRTRMCHLLRDVHEGSFPLPGLTSSGSSIARRAPDC